jgi:hypothetical protein
MSRLPLFQRCKEKPFFILKTIRMSVISAKGHNLGRQCHTTEECVIKKPVATKTRLRRFASMKNRSRQKA